LLKYQRLYWLIPKKILWQNRLTGSTLIVVGLIMGTT